MMDVAYIMHCMNAYPKLIKFVHEIGQTDEITLDITSEAQLDRNRVDALTLLRELGEL